MSQKSKTQFGFTLAEAMLSMGIGSIVLAGVFTSYIFGVKGFRSLANYTEMHTAGRSALDAFARDARISLAVTSCTADQITFVLPCSFNVNGSATSSNLVTHRCTAGVWYRIDANQSRTKSLATRVQSMAFILYDRDGNITTQADHGASIRISAQLQGQAGNWSQTESIISPPFRLRNKQ